MAKREIKRQVEEVLDMDNKVVDTVDVTQALPAEKPARPVEAKAVVVKPVDVSVTFNKLPSYMAVRILSKFVLFNDGHKMRRENIVPGKPVTITITQ